MGAMSLSMSAHQIGYLLLIRDVAHKALGGDALFSVGVEAAIDQLLVDVVKHNPRAGCVEGFCNGEADAIACARDPCRFSAEAEFFHKVSHRISFLSFALDDFTVSEMRGKVKPQMAFARGRFIIVNP